MAESEVTSTAQGLPEKAAEVQERAKERLGSRLERGKERVAGELGDGDVFEDSFVPAQLRPRRSDDPSLVGGNLLPGGNDLRESW
jgi:hypothetical protein